MDDTHSPVPRPAIRFGATVLDTPDPKGLSSFYADLLGWSVDPDDDSEDWVTIRSADGAQLGFQLATEFRAPTWPDAGIPQQFHLDLMVQDLDAVQTYAESLGYAKGGTSWRRLVLVPQGCRVRLMGLRSTDGHDDDLRLLDFVDGPVATYTNASLIR